MAVPDAFKNLALDTWYKVFVYIGGVGFVATLFAEAKGLSNGQAQLLTMGFFLVGIGEWKNHKTAKWFKPPNVYTGGAGLMSTKVRQPDGFGLTCDFLGLLLMLIGFISVIVKCI
ncbi:MAG: hypothetical protein ACTSX8_05980 [Alphaproteobacteria bacterium]